MERSQEQSSLVRQEEETLRGISCSLDVPHGREKSKQEIPSFFGGSGSFVQPLHSHRVDKGMNLTLFLVNITNNASRVIQKLPQELPTIPTLPYICQGFIWGSGLITPHWLLKLQYVAHSLSPFSILLAYLSLPSVN